MNTNKTDLIDLQAAEITQLKFKLQKLKDFCSKVADSYLELSDQDMGRYCEIPIHEWEDFCSLMWDSPVIGEVLRSKTTPPATPKGE